MATSNKKPTSKVESDTRKGAAAAPADTDAPRPRATRRKPAAQPAPIATAKPKRASSGDAPTPARPRRKAAVRTDKPEPVRAPDTIELSDNPVVQSTSPVPTTQSPPPTREQVARRAYEIFLSRGGQHGHHDEDWQQAERELCANE